MCRRLKERSLVDHIFISYKSQASDSVAQRDTKQDDELLTDLPADGNTQGKQTSVQLYKSYSTFI